MLFDTKASRLALSAICVSVALALGAAQVMAQEAPAAASTVNLPAPPTIKYDYDMDIFHPVSATNGMVASEQRLASEIGLDILKKGGNAIDAAVAVGFALAVALPNAGNLGGGGFMMVHEAKSGKTIALDFREMAPAKAGRDMYLDDKGQVINPAAGRCDSAGYCPGRKRLSGQSNAGRSAGS